MSENGVKNPEEQVAMGRTFLAMGIEAPAPAQDLRCVVLPHYGAAGRLGWVGFRVGPDPGTEAVAVGGDAAWIPGRRQNQPVDLALAAINRG